MFLFRTRSCFAMLLVRLGVGGSLLSHGLAKLGLFGRAPDLADLGFIDYVSARADGLAAAVGGDPWMGWLAIAAETVGAAALILGFFGRFCALCIAGLMAVAAWKVGAGPETIDGTVVMQSVENGYYLEWWKSTTGSYHLLATLASLAIVIRGSGALSVDRGIGGSKDDLE